MRPPPGRKRPSKSPIVIICKIATGSAGSGPTPLSGIQREADLHCHLPVRNLVILEMAAHLGDLKPLHISDRLASSRDRVVHCVFDAVWRGTDQLNLFVDVVTH